MAEFAPFMPHYDFLDFNEHHVEPACPAWHYVAAVTAGRIGKVSLPVVPYNNDHKGFVSMICASTTDRIADYQATFHLNRVYNLLHVTLLKVSSAK
eukprot:scaffold499982_cov18-Prasinocladus_malaysianus.AAC.1